MSLNFHYNKTLLFKLNVNRQQLATVYDGYHEIKM